MEFCERCGTSADEIRLFDAILNGKMSILCERCSIIENILIIKKPDASQLSDSEKAYKVYERMKMLAGIEYKRKDDTFFREDRLNLLDAKPELELPQKEKLNLLNNFHWDVIKNRRRKGLSHKQLAIAIGESEIAIEMIEKGKLPENVELIINKLEQFFQARFRKIDPSKLVKTGDEKPILLDEQGNELSFIPEDEIEIIDNTDYEKSIDGEKLENTISLSNQNENSFLLQQNQSSSPSIEEKQPFSLTKTSEDGEEFFDIKKANTSNISIGDLQVVHRKKVEATRLEQIEEQKKIEERRKILLALRERDRLKLEDAKIIEENEKIKLEEETKKLAEEKRKQESDELDSYLGGSELLDDKNSD